MVARHRDTRDSKDNREARDTRAPRDTRAKDKWDTRYIRTNLPIREIRGREGTRARGRKDTMVKDRKDVPGHNFIVVSRKCVLRDRPVNSSTSSRIFSKHTSLKTYSKLRTK